MTYTILKDNEQIRDAVKGLALTKTMIIRKRTKEKKGK
jgi:hypothetical protein